MHNSGIFQSRCRQYLACMHYVRIRKAAITTQCAWRGRVARKELRKLKMVLSVSLSLSSYLKRDQDYWFYSNVQWAGINLHLI